MKLLLIFLAMLFTILPGKVHAEEFSVKQILANINLDGPQKVLFSIYNNEPKWQLLLENISTGETNWLKVANELSKSSDAGASEMLSLAVGEALKEQPGNVFLVASKHFQLSKICSGPDIDNVKYNSYELATEEIRKRIYQVSLVNVKDLKHERDVCIQYLTESKKGIASFYKIN